ncbi:site-specific integrase [Rhizobiaceae bacterium n13]|uniref:Site-specific integrase n=1 Tax=Ferirhizobium litorale TaxID=2927786 RepID=A0AAE3U467_9HYPH|nr:site-specific integrase [Fererhizobium litorale]MDI7863167.1 site-specific integrase [Fererhizobium litorale]MDI7923098.1 site-specific integrase [Fererhizobium litorale]
MPITMLDSGPTCSDHDGVPRLWSTIWAQWFPLQQSRKATARKLTAANFVYEVADELHGTRSLDRFLCDGDVTSLKSVLSAVFFRLRNKAVKDGKNMGTQFDDAMRFVIDILEKHREDESGEAVQDALTKLVYQYRDTNLNVNSAPPQIRALPEEVINDLFEIFNPLSSRNPFRTIALRWRNFMFFLLLLETGMRRGESALLTSTSLYTQFDSRRQVNSFWLNIRQTVDEDPRYEAPSLKTVNATRQIPVSASLAAVMNLYELEYRPQAYSEFFVISQKSNPISLRQLNQILEVATKHLLDEVKESLARRGVQSVSCHELRHSCACMRLRRHLDQGLTLPAAQEKLRDFFGWSSDSNMPIYYSRAEFEPKASETWNQVMDSTVAVLRRVGFNVAEADDA